MISKFIGFHSYVKMYYSYIYDCLSLKKITSVENTFFTHLPSLVYTSLVVIICNTWNPLGYTVCQMCPGG